MSDPVAIVGMSVHLPGAPDLDTYWRNLRDGVDAITDVPAGRHDPGFHADGPAGPDRTYCHRGGFVDPDVPLDLRRHGIVPGSVPTMEPDQLYALRVATAALEDAGGASATADPERIGVVLGRGGYLSSGLARYEQRVRSVPHLLRTLSAVLPGLGDRELASVRTALLDELGPHSPEATIGLVPNLAASRLANRLDLRGPVYTVDAACASSLIAVDHAVRDLAAGRCDAVLAGGVHHCHDETLWATFTELGALSRAGRIAPLSTAADGLLIGEGTGVVVLKRLSDARRDGNRVYAVITGSGVAGDGRGAGLFAPQSRGQAAAVRAAWREAGVDPALPGSVGLLEAHGTATRAGDDCELETVNAVFGRGAACHRRAVIGSVKSMIGHTMPAAGVASLVKVALALHHRTLLPTLHCDEPNPRLAGSRFDVLSRAREWEPGLHPRRAAVNAFGFGGINAHAVLEEDPVAARVRRPGHGATGVPAVVREPEPVLLLAAADTAALAGLLDRPDAELLDRARRGTADPGAGPCRVGLPGPTARSLGVARKVVRRALDGGPASWRGRADVWFTAVPLLPAGGVTFVLPGLEAGFTARCDDVAGWLGRPAPAAGVEVGADLLAHADAVMDLGRLLAAGCRRAGLRPDALVGHSVGEWSAMAVAGMFGDAGAGTDPAVLRRRYWTGGFAVPDVVFAALGCPVDTAAGLVADEPELVVSHDNAPHQSVVCGPAAAVERLRGRCGAAGVVARVLPFRSGFHTPALAGLLDPFRSLAAALPMHRAEPPVWSCTAAAPFPDDPDRCRELYLRHLVEPVRFRETVERLHRDGQRFFVVLGPGQVGSFVADTLSGREHLVVSAASAGRDGLDQVRRVAVAYWVEGGRPAAELLPAASAAARSAPPLVALRPDAVPPSIPAEVTARLRVGAAVPAYGGAPAGLPEQVGAQLAALRAETEAAASSVLALLHRTGAAAPAVPAAVPAPPAGNPGTAPTAGDAGTAPPTRDAGAAAVTGPAGGPPPDAGPPAGHTERVRIGLDTMPHLRDHCLHRLPPDWPDDADRTPVVPATAMLQLAADAVTRARPGTAVTGFRDARFRRWLAAAPACEVTLHIRDVGPDRVLVEIEGHAGMTVCTGPAPAPGPDRPLPADDAPPGPALAEVYERRLMFHGPAYQGLAAVTGVGAGHARGTIVVPPAPGALLDNVGQLLGVWMFAGHDEGLLAFPRAIEAIDLYGPAPGPGARVGCDVRAHAPDRDTLLMDARLTAGGRVVADVRGWNDARLDCDRAEHRVYAFPDRHRLGRPFDGGWVLFHDDWDGAAARNLHGAVQLGAAERDRLAGLDPRRRRSWLAGRIAAKDAVRLRLPGPVHPAELEIVNEPGGRPRVRGRHGRDVHGVEVSLAHTGAVGVALAGPPGSAPGIDVEPVRPAEPGTLAVALTGAERDLHDRLDGGTGTWFTRFWTAKEAVAKARGTGLLGRPRDYVVTGADERGADVTDPAGRTHRVHHTGIDIAGTAHVVARTGGADSNSNSDQEASA